MKTEAIESRKRAKIHVIDGISRNSATGNAVTPLLIPIRFLSPALDGTERRVHSMRAEHSGELHTKLYAQMEN